MLKQSTMLWILGVIFQCYYVLSNSQDLTTDYSMSELNPTTIVDDYNISDYGTTDSSFRYPERSRTCGQSIASYRIVNGEKLREHSQPWAVRLEFRSRGSLFCGGSLISNKHVLTAAHCTNSLRNPNEIVVILGGHNFCDWDNSKKVSRHSIKKIHQHENYDSYIIQNDIAILELYNSVTFTTNIRPIALPYTSKPFVNTEALVIGWGSIGEGRPLSCDLLQVKIPIVSNPYCKSLYSSSRAQITTKQICALYHGRIPQDSCQGDSGGPLIYQHGSTHVQIGIVSWGIGCARESNPGVYTRVSKFIDWIDGIMGSDRPCDLVYL